MPAAGWRFKIKGNVTHRFRPLRWVVIFSPHPEGNLEGDVDAEEYGTLKLLENAAAFASGERQEWKRLSCWVLASAWAGGPV